MKLWLDLDTKKFVASASSPNGPLQPQLTRGDTEPIEVRFTQGGEQVAIPGFTSATITAKEQGKFSSDADLFQGSLAETADGSSQKYAVSQSISSAAIDTLLGVGGTELESKLINLVVIWSDGTNTQTSEPLEALLINSIT